MDVLTDFVKLATALVALATAIVKLLSAARGSKSHDVDEESR